MNTVSPESHSSTSTRKKDIPSASPPEKAGDVPCLLCGSSTPATLYESPPFRIVRCGHCSLVYTLPRLPSDQLNTMYEGHYWRSNNPSDFGYADYLDNERLYLKTFRARTKLLVQACPPPARVLEVGCAAGFALQTMRGLGYDVYGTDISRDMTHIAAQRIGKEKIHCGPLTPTLFGGQFAALVLFDVVEHVEDPLQLLAIGRELLAPDGVLLLETQNVSSLFARLMGIRWHHYKFQEHLYHFSPRTIRLLLEQAGFTLVTWSPRRAGKYVPLSFIAERAGRVSPLLARLLGPLTRMGNPSCYINPFDEMLVLARPNPRAKPSAQHKH